MQLITKLLERKREIKCVNYISESVYLSKVSLQSSSISTNSETLSS